MKIQLVLILLDVVYCSGLTQPQHASLTQQAAVACWKTESAYNLKFFLVKNADQIEAVYTVRHGNSSDNSLGVFDSAGNGIEGDGTVESPFTFEVAGIGDLPGTPISCPASDIELKKTRAVGSDTIAINVMAKSRLLPGVGQELTFAEDVTYAASCNFSDVQPLVVSTGSLTVEGSINEKSEQATDRAFLEILQNGSPTTEVSIGDVVQLSVRAVLPTRATGVYVHSCFVCNTDDCSELSFELIDSRGCSSILSPFLPSDGVSAATDPFRIFTFAGLNYIIIRCQANFCYDASDPKCQNYCASNGGRKRRQTGSVAEPSPDREVWTLLVIKSQKVRIERINGPEEQQGDTIVMAGTSKVDMDIVLVVSILGGMLLVALIVSCVVFFCLTSRRRSKTQDNNIGS